MSEAVAPSLRHVMRIDVELGPPHDVGPTPIGYRRVLPIVGGAFHGDRLRGEVIPGGADWNAVGHDEVMRLRAEYLLRTDDNVYLGIVNEGLVCGPSGVMHDVTGRDFSPKPLYTRLRSRFEAPVAGAYDWLNRAIFIGVLLPPERLENVSMEIWEVL